jgi:hypothetical protein
MGATGTKWLMTVSIPDPGLKTFLDPDPHKKCKYFNTKICFYGKLSGSRGPDPQ